MCHDAKLQVYGRTFSITSTGTETGKIFDSSSESDFGIQARKNDLTCMVFG
jgi:hypothetical protein